MSVLRPLNTVKILTLTLTLIRPASAMPWATPAAAVTYSRLSFVSLGSFMTVHLRVRRGLSGPLRNPAIRELAEFHLFYLHFLAKWTFW